MTRTGGFFAVCAVLLGTALAYPTWWTGTAYGFGDDALEYAVPFATFVKESLRSGSLPLWNAFQDGGAPTLAQPPWMGPLYPGFALFAILPAGRALDAGFAIHVLAFALGTYGLARRRGISRLAAVLAAWAVAAGTPMRTLFRMGYLPEAVALSFLPWLLLCAERGIRERAHLLPATAAAGLFAGLMHLGGHLVASGVVVISLALYALGLGVVRVRREGHMRGLGDALIFVAGAELLGIALAAPQLFPLIEAGLESSLGGGRPVAADEYAYLEQAWRMGNFLFAAFDPVAKGHVFVGTVLLVFVPLAWRRRTEGVAPAPSAASPTELVVLGAGSALLLVGNATPVWTVLRALLPPLRIFSYFYFFVVPLGLALVLLAAHGIDRWRTVLEETDIESRRAAGRAIGFTIVVLLFGAVTTLLVISLGSSEPKLLARGGVIASLPRSTAFLALTGAVVWIATRWPRPTARACALSALAALVGFELLAHGAAQPRIPDLGRRVGSKDAQPFDATSYFDRDAIVQALPEPGTGRVLRVERSRYAAWWALGRNEGLVQGYEDVERASKLPFARAVELTSALREIDLDWAMALSRSKRPPTPDETLLHLSEGSTALRILDLLDVKAIVTDGAVLGRGFKRGPQVGLVRVFHRREGPPRVYAVSAWDEAPDGETAIEATLDPARDPWVRPVIEDAPAATAAPFREAGAATVEGVTWSPGHVRVQSRAEVPALVVIGELAHRGWRVRVDGEAVPRVIANGMHLAVVVPAGTHEIEAVYRPVSLFPAIALSLLALAFALGVGRPLARMRVPPWSPGVPLWW